MRFIVFSQFQVSYRHTLKTICKSFMTKFTASKSMIRIVSGIKNNFEKFSNTTSFHGFYEMHNAKHRRYRLVWLIIILAAFAVTTFQVSKAVCQYIHQTSSTKINPASVDEILYPTVKLCYSHWLHWVDWKKAYTLNFTKPTLLYGLSFFSRIYSTKYFDLYSTKVAFEKQMAANNFTRISEFYRAIARPFPIIDFTQTLDMNLSYFDQIDIMHKLDTSTVLCYSIDVEVMKKSFLKFVHSSYVFAFGIRDTTFDFFSDYITNEEYSHYVTHWLQCHTNFAISPEMFWADWRNYSLPVLLYTDPFSEDPTFIEYENNRYKINFDVSAHRWKHRPCRKNAREFITNRTYHHICQARLELKACKCPDLSKVVLLKEDKVTNLCSNSITFISANRSVTSPANVRKAMHETCQNVTDAEAKSEYDLCIASYLCPCEVWSYLSSATVTKFNSMVHRLSSKSITEILLMFPLGDQTLIMTEVDSQTWEDFVGNVGGLLGIWTGASVLSFVQLLYICCCNDGSIMQKKFIKKTTVSKWKRNKVSKEKRRLSC